MRKFLIGLISILSLALTVYVIINGATFLNINGYNTIVELSDNLDIIIHNINYEKTERYSLKQNELEAEISNFKEIREEYVARVEAAKIKGAKGSKVQIEVYELDFIWTRIGNYASDLGLELKLDVFPGTNEEALTDFKLYNLKFTVLGEYTDIVRFIYKIEGDSEISAQLSDFEMVLSETTASVETEDGETNEEPTTSTSLVAEFVLKNVPLNHKNIIEDVVVNNINNENYEDDDIQKELQEDMDNAPGSLERNENENSEDENINLD